jgi:transcriptional regulator with XRE-family HTH domain
MTTTFGTVLRRILAEQGLSQTKAAERSDLEHSYISRLISGGRTPSREAVVRIADGCGLTAEDSLRLFCSAGFVPHGHESMMLDPELQDAAATLNNSAIPLPYRESLRMQISALVGITRQMAAEAA